MSQFLPVEKMAWAALIVLLVLMVVGFATVKFAAVNRRLFAAFVVVGCMFLVLLLTACGDTINPVRYQPVEVLVTRPCFAGRTPPAEAITLTEPVCTGSDAECVRAAKADILELQREARQYRNLFKECSK